MRTIPADSLALLNQNQGTEPITAIEISWVDGQPNERYADKSFPQEGIQGRILSVQDFDDALNFSKSTTTQQISITLDDSDGHLKDIFNAVDIHRRPVWIYQWFSGIPYSDKFLLFLGVISSPIVWKEGDRTLTFEILSKVVDKEIGFAIEDGEFPFVPQELIGKAWPLVFGTAAMVPALRVDALPHGKKVGVGVNSILMNPFGIHDPALDLQTKDNGFAITFAREQANLLFLAYLLAANSSDQLLIDSGEENLLLVPIDKRSDHFAKQAVQFLKQGNALLLKSEKLSGKNDTLKRVLELQKAHEEKSIAMSNGELFPQNTTLDINVGGATVTGYFSGGNFITLSATHPNAEITAGNVIDPLDKRIGEPIITRNQYFFADAGTPVFQFDRLLNEEIGIIPIRYIICGVIPCNVLGLFAYRTITNFNADGSIASAYRGLYPIPSNYYTLSTVNFGTINAQVVKFPGPISARAEGWEDEIFTILQSSIDGNIVDIIIWLIQNYTVLTYDPVSFAAVRALVVNYTANFAILDRPNAINLIQDIAYQSRCIVYLKDDVFFIKYLPNQADSVDTITESDILLNTLEVTTTETEDLVTKYVAEWSPDYLTKDPFKIILRYNIDKYGLQEETHKYTIYNQQALVDKSALFWLVRNANSWKIVKFKTPIKKLNLESLDTITLNFANKFVSNGQIPGIIQKAVFNSETFEIDFEIWTPVRLGEMDPYPLFYNNNVSEQDIFPTQFDIDHGHVAVTGVTIGDTPEFPQFSGDSGNRGQVTYGPHPASWAGSDIKDGKDTNISPVIETRIDTTAITPVGKKPEGTTHYQLDKLTVPAVDTTVAGTEATSNTNPGIVTGKNGDGSYTCDWYPQGKDNKAVSVTPVRIMVIDSTDTVPNGVGVMITQITFTDPANNKKTVTEYYMQPPVWAPAS